MLKAAENKKDFSWRLKAVWMVSLYI